MELKLSQHRSFPGQYVPPCICVGLCLLYFSNNFVLKTILGILVWHKILATHGM